MRPLACPPIRRRRGAGVYVLTGCGALAGLIALVVGAVALRLAAGSIDLAPVSNAITSGIAKALGDGHRVEIGGIELTWSDGSPQVSVTDLAVWAPSGAILAAAPRGLVGLSLSALALGRVEPVSLSADAPLVALTQLADGTFVPGGPDPRVERGTATPALALLDPNAIGRNLARREPMAGEGLKLLTLDNVTVTIREDVTGNVRTIEPFHLSLRQDGNAVSARFAEGRNSRWWFVAGVATTDSGKTLSVETRGLTGRELLGNDAGTLAGLFVGGILSGSFGEDGQVAKFEGVVDIGGDAAVQGPNWRAAVAPASVRISFEPARRVLEIAPSAIRFGSVGGRLSGRFVLPAAGDPTKVVRGTVALDTIVLGDDARPIPEIQRVNAAFAFEGTTRILYLDVAEAHGERLVASARGQLNFTGPIPGVVLEAGAQGLSAETAKRIWPHFVAPEAQEWFVQNVEAGTLESLAMTLRVPPGWMDGRDLQRDMFLAQWRFSGGAARLAPGMPPVTGVTGTLRTTGNSVRAEARDGVITLPAGTVRVPTIEFVSNDMERPDAVGILRARAEGPAGPLLELGESQGVPLAGSGGIDTRSISGDGVASVEVTFPIKPARPEAPQPRNRVTADLTNIAGRGIFEGRDLERGAFRIESDGALFSAEGTGTVAGTPVKLSARKEGEKMLLRAEIETDDAQRARFGLQLAPMLTGSATVRLIREVAGTAMTHRVELDLTQARLNLPEAAFEKARGVPATVTAVMRVRERERERVAALDDIVVQGRGFSARGRVRLGDDNLPSLIDMTDVRLRGDDNFAVRIERGDGRQTVRVTGRSIDLRPFLKNVLATDGSEPSTNERLDLNVRVDRAVGHNATAISDLRLELTRTGARMSDIKLGGSFGGATRIVGEVLSDAGRPYVRLISTDGGAAFRFLDLYRNMRGGNLTVTQTLTDPTGRNADGVLFIDNFRVVNDPALGRLFGAAPADPEGTLRRVQTDDVAFDRMRVVFSRAPGEITLSDGVLRNLNVGMTYEGRIDFRRSTVDVRGVFIPAFALNNFLARIPIVGMFMGGRDEGLIGVTYQVSGPISGPTLQVNPASAIAPGFLRHIFAFRDAQAPGRAPPRPEPPN